MPVRVVLNYRRWSQRQERWFNVWGIQDLTNGKWWTGEKWSDKPEEAKSFEKQKDAAGEFAAENVPPAMKRPGTIQAVKLPEKKEPVKPVDE